MNFTLMLTNYTEFCCFIFKHLLKIDIRDSLYKDLQKANPPGSRIWSIEHTRQNNRHIYRINLVHIKPFIHITIMPFVFSKSYPKPPVTLDFGLSFYWLTIRQFTWHCISCFISFDIIIHCITIITSIVWTS